jgi:hypothetical protein
MTVKDRMKRLLDWVVLIAIAYFVGSVGAAIIAIPERLQRVEAGYACIELAKLGETAPVCERWKKGE